MWNREKVLSSIQYATGWALLFLFGYSFALPVFIGNVPKIPFLNPFIFPLLILTFFTHATLGVRSTSLRYRIWRPWLDLVFAAVWFFLCLTFLLVYLG
ncbi:hypothetical protein A2797_00520 [candidate division WWE3 bacterium RIFCSPHIGHO2_01_FULL_48_15]|uniref:Uncharacterized protein n=1 Tax=candidate division WWE3 bacterium RIFCSPHIGHO2_01_FULL_48_15 TaxID=1802619 RepID=A0A1F4VG11_UNCKA|nr:MAG: hypothetical protein A2797_00520 [candidate division WWE3 bacterium RIFCSPHIGHO2_01_FULL_48_15]